MVGSFDEGKQKCEKFVKGMILTDNNLDFHWTRQP
jgi:hypothetical protein